MTSRKQLIVSVLVIGLLLILFFTLYEYYEEEVDFGWGPEANRNPYLAAQLFQEQKGVTVKTADSFVKLDSLDNYETLFIAGSGQIISDKRLAVLLDWVDSGGHLIVAAQGSSEKASDRLFDYLEMEVYDTDFEKSFFEGEFFDEHDKNSDEEEESKEQADNDQSLSEILDQANEELEAEAAAEALSEEERVAAYEKNIETKALSYLRFEAVEGELRTHIYPRLALRHPAFSDDYWEHDNYRPTYWAGSHYGVHFLQLEHGNGLVSVLADADVFTSRVIIYFEHAYLWDVLVGGDKLAILYGVQMPSLWFMLRSYMPETLIAFALFIVAWIWHKRMRFGPVEQQVVTVRRSSAEHIAASAAYTWRGSWQKRLLQPVRDEIQHLAEKRLNGYDLADDNEKLSLLARAADVTESSVKKAMASNELVNEDNFYRTVRLLQRIRESL